ncbi:MAG: hypothetical protein KBS64_07280, partial [Treponema sp.]|nr:hypothetical protein [Candidatus Treponema equi]
MKSIFNKFFARFAFGLSFVLPLVATLSCEVGLGEAVDVSAPTCTITYPPSGAVVRDSFILAGECNDDVKVTRVVVRVTNTSSNGKQFFETDADIDLEDKKFSVVLNEKLAENDRHYNDYNGWQFADGTYEITAWAYDNSGKTSGVSSRSIDIDNTAPLFIISKPGVTAGSGDEASAYGSTFAVTGTIADLHEISKMALDVYDKAGNKITNSDSASEV